MNIKKYNIKAISPVVATALLIVVAVVSIVGFQTWFGDFSSGVFSDTEIKSENSVGNTQIDSVIGSSVYFENSGTENITVTEVKVDGVDCNISTNMTNGISELDISSCLENITTSTPEVVIYTNEGIYSEKFYVKTAITSVVSNSTPSVFSGVMEWNATYYNISGSDHFGGVVVDSNSNVYVTGMVALATTDVITIKYDSSGTYIWNVTEDGGDQDYSAENAVDSSGNVFVLGSFNPQILIIKYDSNGNKLWNISENLILGGDLIDLKLDINNNIYAIGYVNNGVNDDYLVIKYNSSGSQLWNKTYDGGFIDTGYAIGVDSNLDVYVSGISNNGLNYDIYLIKYDSDGTELWNVTYGDVTDDLMVNALTISSNNNIYLAGTDYAATDDYLLIKYDSSGNEVWNVTYDGGFGDTGYDVVVDSNENIYVTGYNSIDGVTTQYLTLKYNSTGSILWNATYAGDGAATAFENTIDSEDNFYVHGTTWDGVKSDFITFKYS